jgi:replicative DNA helicase
MALAEGTQVLLANGSSVPVEHVGPEHELLGPCGVRRRVLDNTPIECPTYTVAPSGSRPAFTPYRVSASQVAVLKHAGKVRHGDRFTFPPFRRGEHYEVTFGEFRARSAHFRRLLKGFRSGADWPEREVPVSPYFLGLWIGDGSSDCVAVTTADPEVRDYLFETADRHGLHVRVKHAQRTAPTYRLSSEDRAVDGNSIRSGLREVGVLFNKHIPDLYLTNSRDVRMELLAGLLDSDGHLNCAGVYTIATKWEHLAGQVNRLALSLGLSCRVRPIQAKNQTGKTHQAYRACLYGAGLEALPLLVPRKRSQARSKFKDALRAGLRVSPAGPGLARSLTLDGDGLHLLGDFTVVRADHVPERSARSKEVA